MILICGIGMALLIPVVAVERFALIIALFAVSTFSYAAWSTMALSLSVRPVPQPDGGHGQRPERNRGGRRHHHLDVPDRLGQRPLFV